MLPRITLLSNTKQQLALPFRRWIYPDCRRASHLNHHRYLTKPRLVSHYTNQVPLLHRPVITRLVHNGHEHTGDAVGKVTPKMAIVYTCKVCGQRQMKQFSKVAYEKGIVIVECETCKNRHLIADNLGWFDHIEGR